MEEIGPVSRQFQILRENCDLNIQYSIIECYKHSFEKAIVYLNYDDDKNIDIMTEREKFEDIVEDSWYLIPTYTDYSVNTKWFNYSNVFEFVLSLSQVCLELVL